MSTTPVPARLPAPHPALLPPPEVYPPPRDPSALILTLAGALRSAALGDRRMTRGLALFLADAAEQAVAGRA